jgi:hypothetical protein
MNIYLSTRRPSRVNGFAQQKRRSSTTRGRATIINWAVCVNKLDVGIKQTPFDRTREEICCRSVCDASRSLSGGNKLFGITELFVIETALFPFMVGQPTTREIVSFMADRGCELYDVTEFLRRPYDGALRQVDLAFAKRNGFLRSTNRWA